MNQTTSIADGNNPAVKSAAQDANAVQDAVNLIAIVGCFHRHLLALHKAGVYGDDLNNHPVSLAFVSKFNSLCRMTTEREMAAFNAIDRIERGDTRLFRINSNTTFAMDTKNHRHPRGCRWPQHLLLGDR